MKEDPHTCDLHYHGIRENKGKEYEGFPIMPLGSWCWDGCPAFNVRKKV